MDTTIHNSNLPEQLGYDLGKFTDKHPGSTISYSSKLRPTNQLQPILLHHPFYTRFKLNHLNVIDYPVNDLNEEDRTAIIERLTERGNHKLLSLTLDF